MTAAQEEKRDSADEPRQEASSQVAASRKRRQAREMALQMLYQRDLGQSPAPQIFNQFNLHDYRAETASDADETADPRKRETAFEYAKHLVSGTLEHLEEIDSWLVAQAENWRLERMPVVDRNILRLAAFELAFEDDVPKVVVLDEAIELAKKFGSESSSAFVNGLLDGLVKQRHFPGRLT